MLDDKDRHILELLQKDARINYAQIAEQIELSVSSVHSRIKRLWSLGYIDKETILINRNKVGYGILCFVHVMLQAHNETELERFRQNILKIPEVLECHLVTGEYDTILKVIARDQEHLQSILMGNLLTMPDVGRMQTSISLIEVKSTTLVPVQPS